MVVGLMDREMAAKVNDRWMQVCIRLGEEMASMLLKPSFPVGL